MIIVEEKILVSRQALRRPYYYETQFNFEKNEKIDSIDYWNRNFHRLKMLDGSLGLHDINEINDIYFEWVDAPVLITNKDFIATNKPKSFIFQQQEKEKITTEKFYIFLSMAPNRPDLFESAQQNTQKKTFINADSLFRALLGNYRAGSVRKKEEALAYTVLNRFPVYETEFLNELIVAGHSHFQTTKKKPPNNSYYKDSAKVDWMVEDILKEMDDPEPLARMYKKIAFLHDLARLCDWCCRPKNQKSMRLKDDKYSLDEFNEIVMDDRKNGFSIWAGSSGSAGDMISTAIQLGTKDQQSLSKLSFAIGAFFHFMPTIGAATHTFVEVFRGANFVLSQNGLQYPLPCDGRIPDAAP